MEYLQISMALGYGIYVGVQYKGDLNLYEKWTGIALLSILILFSFRTLFHMREMYSSVKAIELTSHGFRQASNLYDGG